MKSHRNDKIARFFVMTSFQSSMKSKVLKIFLVAKSVFVSRLLILSHLPIAIKSSFVKDLNQDLVGKTMSLKKIIDKFKVRFF